VQQTSDATFRLFDLDRRDATGKSRMLHIEEGLAAIDWSRGPVDPLSAVGFAGGSDHRGATACQPLVRCPYFDLDFVALGEPSLCGGVGRLQALVVLGGDGALTWDERREPLTVGQVWVLPAALPAVQCVPEHELKMLVATLP
jgi:mannose-6-phosphate isomerase